MDKFLEQLKKEKMEAMKKAKIKRWPHHVVRTIGSRTPEELDALAYNVIATIDRNLETGRLVIREDGTWELHFLKKTE